MILPYLTCLHTVGIHLKNLVCQSLRAYFIIITLLLTFAGKNDSIQAYIHLRAIYRRSIMQEVGENTAYEDLVSIMHWII
jgi:hypothetical protein